MGLEQLKLSVFLLAAKKPRVKVILVFSLETCFSATARPCFSVDVTLFLISV